jgi:hypothetical protein
MGLSRTKTVASPKRNRELCGSKQGITSPVTGKFIFSFAVLNAPLKGGKSHATTL